jgi:hypothetical protein
LLPFGSDFLDVVGRAAGIAFRSPSPLLELFEHAIKADTRTR